MSDGMTPRESFMMMAVSGIGMGAMACGLGMASIAQVLPTLLVIGLIGAGALMLIGTRCKIAIDRNRANLLDQGGWVIEPPRQRITHKAIKFLTGGKL